MNTVEEKLESGQDKAAVLTNLDDLSEFKLDKILFNNTNRKTICMQGTFNGNNEVGLVLLEKTAFTQDQFEENCDYFDKKCTLKKLFDNDIYGNYQYFPTIDLNAIKATIIYPATEKHIRKFTVQNTYIVDETPKLYKEVVLPHLTEEHFDLQWVYNILERKSEAERICCEDTDPNLGFTLIPDLKWDGITLDTLYFLALTRLRNLKSLRDLTADHLPLLKNIYTKGTYKILTKPPMHKEYSSVAKHLEDLKQEFSSLGMRRSVEAVIVTHEHSMPHVWLLQSEIYELPGGKLYPGEDEEIGLQRILKEIFGPENGVHYNWLLRDVVANYWRPNFDLFLHPYPPEAIEFKYGLDPSQLRIYIHYQPSFYHLHVHFTYLKHEAPGILVERAHLLTQVISNLELLSNYYQRVNLPFVVRETDNLFKKLEAKGVLRKLEPKQ